MLRYLGHDRFQPAPALRNVASHFLDAAEVFAADDTDVEDEEEEEEEGFGGY